jgi:hypothetical protein
MKSEVEGSKPTVSVFVPSSVAHDGSVLDEVGVEDAIQMIDEAVRETGLNPQTDEFRVQWVDWWRVGSQIVTEWWRRNVGQNIHLEKKECEIPWDSFHDDVNYKAPRKCHREMLSVSREAVIVADGQYMDRLREQGDSLRVPVETAFDLHRYDEEVVAVSHRRSDERETEKHHVDDLESMFRSANKMTGLNAQESEPRSESDELVDDDEISVQEVGGYEPEDTPEGDLGENAQMELQEFKVPDGMSKAAAESMDEDSRLDKDDLRDADPGGGKVDEYYDSTS